MLRNNLNSIGGRLRSDTLLWVGISLIYLAAPGAFAEQTLKSDATRFTYFQRLIFVEMSVNNHSGLVFLLDTGANRSAIDLKTAGTLNLPITGTGKVEGTAGTIEVKQVLVKSIFLGKARARDLNLSSYDLSGSLVPPGMHLDGILGYDFLRSFSVSVDFARRTITFSPRAAANPIHRSQGNGLPFVLDNGIPRVRATLNDSVRAEFRLDTGASLFETQDVYLNVTASVWEQLTALDAKLKPTAYLTGGGIGGEVKLPVARIRKFSAGTASISSPFVIVQPKLGYFARSDAVGFISNNLLEKFSPVTIDYLERKLYLGVKKKRNRRCRFRIATQSQVEEGSTLSQQS